MSAAQPVEAARPVEPAQPVQAAQPVEAVQPVEAARPVEQDLAGRLALVTGAGRGIDEDEAQDDQAGDEPPLRC
ncbi:hypothetical protein ACWEGQ_34795, partial [Streptomyces seoulensis]